MKKIVKLMIAVLVVVGIAAVLVINFKKDDTPKITSESKPMPDTSKVQKNNNDEIKEFNLSFLKLENNKKNMMYSPLSIKYALNMLNEGASGETKKQIENVLKNNKVNKYNNIKDKLSLANAMYIRDTFTESIKPEYKNILTSRYNAEIKPDPFKSADDINKWIKEKTFGQIENMISNEQINNAQMVLINSLAIDMKWKEPFDGGETDEEDFYLEDGSKMEVAMMNNETSSDGVSYYQEDDVTALGMDLEESEGQQFEFIAIMPKDKLSEYAKDVSESDIDKITENMKKASDETNEVEISIPKFSFDYDLQLKNDLQKLNVTDAFEQGKANFSAISDKDDLFVSEALHKANIDCSEEGVKAAATTAMMLEKSSIIMGEEIKEIKIDKPFLYLIRDKKTKEIWFLGTVYEPTKWAENEKKDEEDFFDILD